MHKFGCALLCAACALFGKSTPAAQVAEGKQVFNVSCATGYCHGLDGRAGRGPRLRDRVWPKNYLYKTIEEGIPGSSMPAWRGKLSEGKIAAVVSYILSISKEEAGPKAEVEAIDSSHTSGLEDSPGKALFFDLMRDRNCGVCHQVVGAGAPIAPQFTSFQGIAIQTLLDKITSQPAAGRNVTVSLAGGEQFCGVRAGEDAGYLRIYDLAGTGPPVLRTIDKRFVLSATPCPALNVHANNAAVYSSRELQIIAAFLKRRSVSEN